MIHRGQLNKTTTLDVCQDTIKQTISKASALHKDSNTLCLLDNMCSSLDQQRNVGDLWLDEMITLKKNVSKKEG